MSFIKSAKLKADTLIELMYGKNKFFLFVTGD